jgi:aspartyl-tRNA(Asn)/glutamyl-tRNA(Gln) amidotransferase subunit A
MSALDPSTGGIRELLEGYRARQFSPLEVLESRLDRMRSLDDAVGAVETLVEDAHRRAEAATRRWREGRPRALEGIPFGVKDIIQVEGTPTTFGSAEFQGYQSETTAEVVRALRSAGAVLVAKLATYEFAGGPNERTRNPWDLRKRPGGSSSGSAAAVAARYLPLAIGTDTGGSIRVPASWCGVVGLKPTYGTVSCAGIAPLSWTLDHVGPLSMTVEDAMLALDAMTGPRRPPVTARPATGEGTRLDGVRLGRPGNWFFDDCETEIRGLVDDAVDELARAGATIVELDIPILHHLDPDIVKHVIVGAEAASFHEPMRERWSGYTDTFAANLEFGVSLTAADYVRALRLRSSISQGMAAALAGVDAVVTPTSVIAAPDLHAEYATVGGRSVMLADVVARNTSVFNICGFPAVTVPCGLTRAGLPAGLQIAAAPWREDVCARIGAVYQHRTGHHRAIPPMRADLVDQTA